MIQAVVLDTTPLGLVTQRRGKSEPDACRLWMEGLLTAGVKVYVPEIADYELRRELLLYKKIESIGRLDRLKTRLRALPITTEIMLKAAELWAWGRGPRGGCAG